MPHGRGSDISDSSPKIKLEPEEIHPLEYYVGDRVELIRQAFKCLKTKTIKSLAPDCLKGKTIEALQEYCLDEVLGISTKRLKAIINATSCPSDTDTSDSDVQINEHISVDEISSDEESPKKSKNKAIVDKKATKNGTKEKSTADNDENSDKSKKELTVLELLELQARARAIRSQLALEPVTKIELDSTDDETDENSIKSKVDEKPVESIVDNKSTTVAKSRVHEKQENVSEEASTSKQEPRKIRIKRNYRDNKANKSAGNDKPVEESCSPCKSPKIEKEPSPDIIPIIPSPITLCISDSEEEEGEIRYETTNSPKQAETSEREKTPESKVVIEVIEDTTIMEDTTIIEDTATEEPMELNSDKDSESDQDVINLDQDDDLDEKISDPEVESKPKELLKEDDKGSEKEKGKSNEKQESWNNRWLRSSKVSKILATSRLAARVKKRTTTKQKEKAQKEMEQETLPVENPPPETPAIDPNVEIGSVEHYESVRNM